MASAFVWPQERDAYDLLQEALVPYFRCTWRGPRRGEALWLVVLAHGWILAVAHGTYCLAVEALFEAAGAVGAGTVETRGKNKKKKANK